MRRIFRELGHDNLCVATPFVQLENGQRIIEEMGDYPTVSITRALAGGWIVDAAASQQTKVATTSKKIFTENNMQLVIDAVAATDTAKIYLGLGQKEAAGVEGVENLDALVDSLGGATINGTYGADSLKQFTSLAYKSGFKIKNIQCTAKTGEFYDKPTKWSERDPIGNIEGKEKYFYFSLPTDKSVNTNIRTMAGFTGEFNGYNALYLEVPKTEKIVLTFEFEMMY